MNNPALSLALTGVVPSVCDSEAGGCPDNSHGKASVAAPPDASSGGEKSRRLTASRRDTDIHDSNETQNLYVAPIVYVRPMSVWNNVSSRTLSMNKVLRSSVRFCASRISVRWSLKFQDAAAST